MKKPNKKLSLKATTVRILQASLPDVVGGMGPITANTACSSHYWECDGGSHAATCGNGTSCGGD